MTTEFGATPLPASPIPVTNPGPRWRLATRLAFRFSFLYFGLYILLTQMFPAMNPFIRTPILSTLPPIGPTVMWVIREVFGDTRQLVMVGGSGDKMFDWVFVLCLLMFSLAMTSIWSVVDRKRLNYVTLLKWFRLYVRFGLATTMLTYGMVKAIPLQMGEPSLTRLLEPYGHFSPMGVLWASIGASFPYERFAGGAELLASVLLFIPQTAMLGAFVALIDSIQIFALNMTYDVPVKLFSFHLILLSVFLLAPDISRLLDVFVFNRPAPASTQPAIGRARGLAPLAVAVQVMLGAYLIWNSYTGSLEQYNTRGAGAPRPPLYGVWVIDRMSINGIERAPLVTDYDRWRRVVIQSATGITFWRMDDTPYSLQAKYDMEQKVVTITLGTGDQSKTVGSFSLDQTAPDRLVFAGELDGKKIRMETVLFPRERFPLVSRGFNWVQELPFNR
jgi:hypothetical protein